MIRELQHSCLQSFCYIFILLFLTQTSNPLTHVHVRAVMGKETMLVDSLCVNVAGHIFVHSIYGK